MSAHQHNEVLAADVSPPTGWRGSLKRLQVILDRFPWLLPALSFGAGWIGFVMVQRGEGVARYIAVLALIGWPWLLIEPLIRRPLEKRKPGMGKFVVNFVSQSLQQELLFFSLPFMIGATQRDIGQMTFTALAAAAALFSTVDPLYERFIATRATRRLLFHAYCSWMAALVVLPMVARMPVERALPLSLWIVSASLVLTLPWALLSLRTWKARLLWIACLGLMPLIVWELRGHVPAAGLAVTEARITQSIDELNPGAPVTRLTVADLERGVMAYAAIRAPTGLLQTIVFRWRHGKEAETIIEQIHGGRQEGWRTWSRKQVFPADPRGVWTVDVLTPQGQLLKRLRFVVS